METTPLKKARIPFTVRDNCRVIQALKQEIMLPLSQGARVKTMSVCEKLAKKIPHSAKSIESRMHEIIVVAGWCGRILLPGRASGGSSNLKRHHDLAKLLAKLLFRMGLLDSSVIPEIQGTAIVVGNCDPLAKVSANDGRIPTPTERERTAKDRIGVKELKDEAFADHPGCAVLGVGEKRDLILSHIKAWAFSTDYERLDPENCILLSPNLDMLFNRYDIGIDPATSRIIVSPTCVGGWEHPYLKGIPRHITYRTSERKAGYLNDHLEIVRMQTRDEKLLALEVMKQAA